MADMPMALRWARPGDFDALGQVMYDAVRCGPSPYTDAQRRAWLAAPHKGAGWAARLGPQRIALARRGDGIAGFVSLRPDGYVDFAFIRPSARGAGLFGRLYTMIEDEARALGLQRLWTHASLMAQGPFAARGFVVVARETVQMGAETLARAEMQKLL